MAILSVEDLAFQVLFALSHFPSFLLSLLCPVLIVALKVHIHQKPQIQKKNFDKNPNHFACKQNVHPSKILQWLFLDIKGYDNKEQVGPMRKRTSSIWPHITWNKNYSYRMSSQWLTFDAQLKRQHRICCKYDFIPCNSSNCTCNYAAACTVQYRYLQMTCFGAVRHNCCKSHLLYCCHELWLLLVFWQGSYRQVIIKPHCAKN